MVTPDSQAERDGPLHLFSGRISTLRPRFEARARVLFVPDVVCCNILARRSSRIRDAWSSRGSSTRTVVTHWYNAPRRPATWLKDSQHWFRKIEEHKHHTWYSASVWNGSGEMIRSSSTWNASYKQQKTGLPVAFHVKTCFRFSVASSLKALKR